MPRPGLTETRYSLLTIEPGRLYGGMNGQAAAALPTTSRQPAELLFTSNGLNLDRIRCCQWQHPVAHYSHGGSQRGTDNVSSGWTSVCIGRSRRQPLCTRLGLTRRFISRKFDTLNLVSPQRPKQRMLGPAATAMYCLPSTVKVMGEALRARVGWEFPEGFSGALIDGGEPSIGMAIEDESTRGG